MHNLKEIRKNTAYFKKKIEERNTKVNFDNLIELDKKNRELIQKKESLEQEKKIISKSKNEENFKKSKTLSKEIDSFSRDQAEIQKKINDILVNLPNIALDEVPSGKDETSNKIIRKEGKIKKLNFSIKSHSELGESKNQMDFKTASKLSGSRFVDSTDETAK